MKDAEMDQILSKMDEIVPSSGFTASVMEAVHREAAAPPPIPFPWKRALPFLVLAAAVIIAGLVGGVILLVRLLEGGLTSYAPVPASPWLALTGQGGAHSVVGLLAAALLTALVSVTLSVRMAGGRT